MCNCIDKIRKDIMSDYRQAGHEPGYVKFYLSTITDGKTPDMTGQQIEIGYRKKKKTGEFKDIKLKTFITHTFCPWCGKKYKTT